MPDMNEPQNTLRDVLEANMEAAEAGTLGTQNTEPPLTFDAATGERVRDDRGRFAPKDESGATITPPPATTSAVDATLAPAPAPASEAAPKLTTWRKEFQPLHEKLASGVPLTPDEAKKLADYNIQREREYATGISTYKSEALQARELQQAMQPFMGELQQYNIQPAQWIQNLGNAHRTLALGSPEQKISMFAQLAKEYGVPLAAISQGAEGQLDPVVAQLMAEIQTLKQGVNTVTSWREQQEEQAVKGMLAQFNDAEKYPHYSTVRETMAQLLESGLAPDLETAYTKAVRMNDDAWTAEQARQAQAQTAQQQSAQKAAAAQKAKASAVSVRSATPSGAVTTAGAKDRRALLAEQMDSIAGGRV